MATPTENILNKTFYHGTKSKKEALFVLNNGIHPSDISFYPDSPYKPITGKIYITEDFSHALKYSIGNKFESLNNFENGLGDRYKYLFSISGKNLKDIQPDEDFVGESIYKKTYPTLNTLAEQFIDKKSLEEVYKKNYQYWSHVGKEIMQYIPNDLKIKMIEDGGDIANEGYLPISGAWKFDILNASKLNATFSNFFNLAEKII